MRWVNLPLEESTAKKTDEKAKNFDDNYVGKFRSYRNQSPGIVQSLEQFNYRRADMENRF